MPEPMNTKSATQGTAPLRSRFGGGGWSGLDKSRGVYGATKAAEFIRDLLAGDDSLDIVTIGDSNAGNPGTEGYTNGFIKALNTMGVTMYGTPVFPTGVPSAIGLGYWGGAGLVYVSPSAADEAIKDLDAEIALTDAAALQCATFVPGGTLRPNAQAGWKFAFLDANDASVQNNSTYMELAQPHVASIGPTKTFCQVGATLTLRCRYWKFTTGSGQFKLLVRNTTDGATLATSASFVSSNGASNVSAVEELDFTAPAATKNVRMGWCYLTNATGPLCPMFLSAYRDAIGFSVSNLHYHGGVTSDTIADHVAGAIPTATNNGFYVEYLKELRTRQVAAGGSGRVLVFLNCGINGPDSYADWSDAVLRMAGAIQYAWVTSLGYSQNDIAFVASVSHAVYTDTSDETVLAETRETARTDLLADWKDYIAGQFTGDNMTVWDIPQMFSGTALRLNSMFATAVSDEGHLNSTSGYMKVAMRGLLRTAAFTGARTP